jgi:hypothetical protein
VRLYERFLKRHSITTVDDYFMFLGQAYPLGFQSSMKPGNEEKPPSGFDAYAEQMFKSHPVVYRAEAFRKAVFSQGRYKWRNVATLELFGNRDLRLLERPWPGARTAQLNARMLLHGDLAGNSYVRRGADRLHFMRPDLTTIVLGSQLEPDDQAGVAEDVETVGFLYSPRRGERGRMYLPDEVSHFAPMPDPQANYRGMSWLTPVIREIQADNASTDHKLKYFTNAATPNLAIKFDAAQTKEQVQGFKELLEEEQRGLANAYRTLYLGGGADTTVIGSNLQELDFKNVQGKAETRILMAAGVHPVLAGASEGMQGSSLNAGNYNQVRRNFSDIDLQDLFEEAASSLEVLVRRPDDAELTVDSRHIPFLQDDQKDQSEIQANQAAALRQLSDGGWQPDAAVEFITTNDPKKLIGNHTGLLPVQVQPPGSTQGDSDG